jgi:hypothetical protein
MPLSSIFASTLMLLAISGTDPDSEGWVRILSRDGIEVYNKPASDGSVSWIKGVVTDSVRMEVVGKVLLDVASYPRWMDRLEQSRIVEASSPDDYVLYNRYAAPWPLRDRDIYVRVKIVRRLSEGKVTASITKFESSRYPPLEGLVRIPTMEGRLQLETIGRFRTRGEFSERVDVGGAIPDWGKAYLNRLMPEMVLKYVRKACSDSFYIRAADTSSVRRELDAAMNPGKALP